MARTSRKTINKPQTVVVQNIFKTAIYARLSIEDKKTQGNSIDGQISIAKSFIQEQADLQVINIFIDNGYTGANFQRPQFIRMMEEIRKGNINCIVIKDLSRFGRNYYEIIEYIDQILPSLNVRLISVNEKLDTFSMDFDEEVMNVALKSLMNYAYIMNTSISINSAFHSMRKKGYFISGKPPYGYLRSMKDKHYLVIDDTAATIVKQIFEWKLHGISINQITKNLNFAGELSPTDYFYKIGYFKNEKYATPKKWTFTTVKSILTNQVYAGDMVGAKTRKHFGEVSKRNQEEYIIVKNTHEAIISRADFAAAEKSMEETAKHYKAQLGKPSKIQKPEKIFKGILFCGHCKKHLSSCIAKRTYSYSAAYRCLDCNTYTHKHIYISFNDINNAVFKIVQTDLTSIMDYETKSASIQYSDETKAYISKTKSQIKSNRQLFSEIKNKLSQIYIDYSDGLINKVQFIQIKDSYYQKQKEIEKNITEFENSLLIYDEKAKSSITKLGKQFAQIQTLNAQSINEIIERVEVFHNKVIQVYFKYADEFNQLEFLSNLADKETYNG